jgi:hypothetical protein
MAYTNKPIELLKEEHRSLDKEIKKMEGRLANQDEIKDLKRQKLRLKEQIEFGRPVAL